MHSPQQNTVRVPAFRLLDQNVFRISDEENVLEITKVILENFNYRVLTAMDGADGIEVFAQHDAEIAVVLTQMAMPYLDGPSMIRAIRSSKADITIMGMSGLLSSEQTAELTGLDVTFFPAKPFTAEDLLSNPCRRS